MSLPVLLSRCYACRHFTGSNFRQLLICSFGYALTLATAVYRVNEIGRGKVLQISTLRLCVSLT